MHIKELLEASKNVIDKSQLFTQRRQDREAQKRFDQIKSREQDYKQDFANKQQYQKSLENWVNDSLLEIEDDAETKLKDLNQILHKRLRSHFPPEANYFNILIWVSTDKDNEFPKNEILAAQQFIKKNIKTILEVIEEQKIFLNNLKSMADKKDWPTGPNTWQSNTNFARTIQKLRNNFMHFSNPKFYK